MYSTYSADPCSPNTVPLPTSNKRAQYHDFYHNRLESILIAPTAVPITHTNHLAHSSIWWHPLIMAYTTSTNAATDLDKILAPVKADLLNVGEYTNANVWDDEQRLRLLYFALIPIGKHIESATDKIRTSGLAHASVSVEMALWEHVAERYWPRSNKPSKNPTGKNLFDLYNQIIHRAIFYHFFDLLRELRDQIYLFILPSGERYLSPESYKANPGNPFYVPALAQTSFQLRSEALPIVRANNNFEFRNSKLGLSDAQDYIHFLAKSGSMYVQNLDIAFLVCPHDGDQNMWHMRSRSFCPCSSRFCSSLVVEFSIKDGTVSIIISKKDCTGIEKLPAYNIVWETMKRWINIMNAGREKKLNIKDLGWAPFEEDYVGFGSEHFPVEDEERYTAEYEGHSVGAFGDDHLRNPDRLWSLLADENVPL